jgi:NADPH:quinone reductase-like Zn-dependent oxidoreductase
MDVKAWKFRKDGAQYALKPESVCLPDLPPPNSIRVRIRAASLNYRDIVGWKNLAGRPVDGRTPCSDGAGEIMAVGSDVRGFQVGERVAGCFFQTWMSGRFEMMHHRNDLGGTIDGMLQQMIDLPSVGVVRIPDYLSYEQAATLPCAGLTAWYSLVHRGQLSSGETVLCIGTGGVSMFALQFATALGAKVIVLSSSDEKLERAKAMGAWQTLNYRNTPDWGEEVLHMTDGKGVDHVVEVGGQGTLGQSLQAVAPGGHVALIGVLTGFGPPSASLFPLLAKNIRLNGIYVGSKEDFQSMNEFLAKSKIEPVIDRVFPFEQADAAFEYLYSAKHFGKVVVKGCE